MSNINTQLQLYLGKAHTRESAHVSDCIIWINELERERESCSELDWQHTSKQANQITNVCSAMRSCYIHFSFRFKSSAKDDEEKAS